MWGTRIDMAETRAPRAIRFEVVTRWVRVAVWSSDPQQGGWRGSDDPDQRLGRTNRRLPPCRSPRRAAVSAELQRILCSTPALRSQTVDRVIDQLIGLEAPT